MIQINVNNMTNEIDKFVSQNPNDYGNSNSSTSTRHLKFTSFFVNNKSIHFEQLTIMIEIIQVIIENIKANNMMNTPF